jgi:O-antigen ligase
LGAVFIGPSPWPKLAVLLCLATPQLYLLPEGTTDISLSTAFAAVLAPGVLISIKRGQGLALFRTVLFRVLLALLAVRLLALAWSPDPRAGLPSIALLGQFMIVLVLMVEALRQDSDALWRLLRFYWPWVLLEVLLVVLFRLRPEVEDAFLRSVAEFFAGQNTVAGLFGEYRNNVLDPTKSGGVFVNANVAAMFLGVNGLAALAVSAITRSRWVRVVGVIALLAVPFTSSKVATILAFALPALAIAILYLTRPMTTKVRIYLLAGSGLLGIAGVLVLAGLGLLGQLTKAFSERTIIWSFAVKSFPGSAVLGLGYGGWEIDFPPYAAEQGLYKGTFPPHNLLLAAWSVSGLVGLALTVVFIVLTLWLAVSRLSRRAHYDTCFVAFGGAAIGWVFIQGMGENTDVFGEIHLIPVLALLIGYLVRHPGKERYDDVVATDSRSSEAPAVPTLGDVHLQPGDGATRVPSAVRGEGCDSEQLSRRLG